MSQINKWEHLILKGEFADRKKIVSGLTFEQVNKKPAEGMHSIYEELWHTARWAHIAVNRDSEAEKLFTGDGVFPAKPVTTQQEWDDLVSEFSGLLDKIIEMTGDSEKLKEMQEHGWTLEDNINSLLIHNSYHLGKIVAVRQMLGDWPPKENKN